MEIIMFSGSSRPESSNAKLLKHLGRLTSDFEFHFSTIPNDLPLFKAEKDVNPLPEHVQEWRRQLSEADGVIICTPEYIFNIPALLKNALEWIASSGELVGKKVLAMTLTPNPPRGEKAMESLLWSLKALDANIVASLPLFQTEIAYSAQGELEGEGVEVLKEALKLFM